LIFCRLQNLAKSPSFAGRRRPAAAAAAAAAAMPSSIADLSADAVGLILVRLNLHEFARSACVCRHFQRAVRQAEAVRVKACSVPLPTLRPGESRLRALRFAEVVAETEHATLACGEIALCHSPQGDRVWRWSYRYDADSAAHAIAAHAKIHPHTLGAECHALVADTNGAVWSWMEQRGRRSTSGELGHGNREVVTIPTRIASLAGTRIIQVAASRSCSLFLTSEGAVLACGFNNCGQLGVGDTDCRLQPAAVPGFADRRVVELSAGTTHSAAVDEAGALWTWGLGQYGSAAKMNALGLGYTNRAMRPTLIASLAPQRVRHVSAGFAFTLAVTAAGELYACGNGERGRLGLGSWESKDTFTLVTALAGIPVISASAGESHSVVLTEAGVYTMGNGDHGQLGHGDLGWRQVPTLVKSFAPPLSAEQVDARTLRELKRELERRGLSSEGDKAALAARLLAEQPAFGRVVEVAAGSLVSLARGADGKVYGWGAGRYDGNGNWNRAKKNVPVCLDWLESLCDQLESWEYSA
jgi:alpha-tubulin suppressor-like RCC1 family protein